MLSAAHSAHEHLADAIASAHDLGLRIPCARSDDWLSDLPSVRSVAASRCDGCPALEACHAAADETSERFGVWAGRDRTTSAGRKAASANPTLPERNPA